ncbi:hypothetical protein MOF01_08035 [Bacillus spizizenii]|nr:hypothetical protein [Bacillus spizizenii]
MDGKITAKLTAGDGYKDQFDKMRQDFTALSLRVLSDEPKSKEKWRQALVVGRTVNEAKAIWKRVKANYPSCKYTKFVSWNPCGIDSINAENVSLFMLPGYADNPIVKDSHFRWIIEMAAEVIYVEEDTDE